MDSCNAGGLALYRLASSRNILATLTVHSHYVIDVVEVEYP